jgi:hypothetical protein
MLKTFVILAMSLPFWDAPAQERNQRPDSRIKVFRHHPDMLDTKERMEARDRDAKLILKTVESDIGSYRYEGGLGHNGYVLSIYKDDLAKWKAAIEKLRKAGALKYYDRWELDKSGLGLMPLPKD